MIAEREFKVQAKCEKAKKAKEEERKKRIEEAQSKRWEELRRWEQEMEKLREEARQAALQFSKKGGASPTRKLDISKSPIRKPQMSLQLV